MRKLALFLLVFITQLSFGQFVTQWNWVKNSVGVDGPTTFADSYTDPSGNTYVVGTMGSSTLSIDNSSTTNPDWAEEVGQICAGGCITLYKSDIFVAKLDNSGNVSWLNRIGGTETEKALSLAVNENGEVWVLGSSSGDTISVGSNKLKLERTNSYSSSTFLAKFNANGNFGFLSQVTGESTSIYDGELFINENTLSLFASFRAGSNDKVNIYDQSISPSYNNTAIIKVDINASTGAYVASKEIGNPVSNNSSQHNVYDIQLVNNNYFIYGYTSDAGIKMDNETLNFASSEYYKKYVAVLSNDGVCSSIFEHNSKQTAKMAVNTSKIALITSEQHYQDFTKLLQIRFSSYSGTDVKQLTLDNEDKQQINININAVTLDDNNKVTLIAGINTSVTIDGNTYSIAPSVYKTESHGDLTNNFNDMFLMSFDYNEGLEYIKQIEGEHLQEAGLSLANTGSKIRMIASYESPSIQLDDHTLVNENNEWFEDFHGEPTAYHLQNNLLFADLEIKEDISTAVDNLINTSLLSPNPSKGGISIEENNNWNTVEIWNTNGSLIRSVSNSNYIDLSAGTYTVRFIGENTTHIEKLIIY